MDKKQIKINGKIAVEIKINGGLFWKADEPEPVFHYDYAFIDSLDAMEADIPLQYNRSDHKWYILNNLGQLEPYGVYEEVSDITTATHYDGKLINVNGDEYQYVGGQWQLVGKIESTLSLMYTFGAGERWDREKPFPMHFQLKKEQIEAAGGRFEPYFMAMEADIRLCYGMGSPMFRVMFFNTGEDYEGEITEDGTWVYFDNPYTGDVMVNGVDYYGSQIEMYAGSFHADVEYGTINVGTKDGEYGSDCSFISEPYVKNKIYNIGGYFMTHTEDGCSRVEGVNPYDISYKLNDTSEFKLYEPFVSSLNQNIFSLCSTLKYLDIPYVESFPGLTNYTMLETALIEGISLVGWYTLNHTSSILKYLKLKDTVVVNDTAFSSHNNLSLVEFPSRAVLLGSKCFVSSVQNLFSSANLIYSAMLPSWSTTTLISGDYYGINSSVVRSNKSLLSVNLPQAHYVGAATFSGCSSLRTVNLEAAKEIGMNTFAGCTYLSSISIPNVVKIGSSAFSRVSKLSSISLPNCEFIDDYGLNISSNYTWFLNSISLPKVKYIGRFGIYSISPNNVERLDFPECEYIGWSALYHLTNSYNVYLHLPKCKTINDGACRGMNVRHLYLNEVSEVTNLQSSTAFMDLAYQDINIYVPSSLVDAFKVDSVWSWFSDYILPYEG